MAEVWREGEDLGTRWRALGAASAKQKIVEFVVLLVFIIFYHKSNE